MQKFVLLLLIMLYKRLSVFWSSRLTSKTIKNSTYNQLVDTIVKEYNYQEYANPSSLALLQTHHHYKIFNSGDWVLDIGAGPTWSWTHLALKMTRNEQETHRVISNDIREQPTLKQNQISIKGDFYQEPIQTKIAMNLMDRKLDTMLIDATPDFSGDLEIDGNYTTQVFLQAIKFANPYLRKGGTIVFKTLQCEKAHSVMDQCKILFNEVYKYQPTSLRIGSPSFMYVLKGHLMTNNFEDVKKLLKQYQGSIKKKISVVEKYRKNNNQWDPVLIINNHAKKRVMDLKKEGRSNKDIFKIFQDDPFIKIKEILEQIDLINDETANPVSRLKASKKFYNLASTQTNQIPESQEEFAQYLFKKSDELLGIDTKEKKNIEVLSKAPLRDDEIYMKNSKLDSKDCKPVEYEYKQEDLYGFQISQKTIEEQKEQKSKDEIEMLKIVKSFPELEQAFKDNSIREAIFNNPAVKKNVNPIQLQELESMFKKERRSGREEFNLEEQPELDMNDRVERQDKMMDEDVEESKRQYMQSISKKEDRYINQKRAKRHIKNRNKF